MNKVILIGRLTKDPDLRYTQNGRAMATFTLAVYKQLSREKKQEMEAQGKATADFPRVTAWGKQAENLSKYLKKGRQCAVEGSIQTGIYKDKDGKTVYTTDVLANNVEYLNNYQEKNNQNNDNSSYEEDDFFDDFNDVEDEGIPF